MARWDHLRALLSCAASTAAALFWSLQYINVGFASQVGGGGCMWMWGGGGGSPLIFMNPVIKTKDGAVPFKSVLSGVDQVRRLARVWGRSCTSAKLRRAAKCEVLLLWLGTASCYHETAGNFFGSTNWRALFAPCPPKPPSALLVFESRFDWVRGEIQGVLCLLCAPNPIPRGLSQWFHFIQTKAIQYYQRVLHESQGHNRTADFERDSCDFCKFGRRSFDRQLLVTSTAQDMNKINTHTHKNEVEKEPLERFLNGPQCKPT